MKASGALLASLVAFGCAAGPISHPARADAAMVRLDIVERGLIKASADLDALALEGERAKTASWSSARGAVDSAARSLECARKAVSAWERGDGRNVEPRMDVLALRLDVVRETLGPAGVRPAPGLLEALAGSDERARSDAGTCSSDGAQGCR